jgi:MFS superfamily sulfate permease-like transporter
VLLDFESVNSLDVTGGDELLRLVRELHSRGIGVGLVRVRDTIREDLRRAGIVDEVGPDNFYERTTDGVRAFVHQATTSSPTPRPRDGSPS